ncbi:ATP-dependent Clp protease adapter ClpS [Rothia sp. ZJ1223]|uniref:ATP-dependent Clp protease adapter ClpS n=1 Tax=unclassified Rothia (in: high G+C Gram-positive bacteria) TaxID=2689056 RepID=UPI00351C4ED3
MFVSPLLSVGETETLPRADFDEAVSLDSPWQVVVWNDPVNLMSFVTYVFRSHFGFSTEKAQRLMLAVHEEGKAVVFTGSREEAEQHTSALHGWGLWATFERVEV